MRTTLIRLIRRVLPDWLWMFLKRVNGRVVYYRRRSRFTRRLAANYFYDFLRYRRYSADGPSPTRENLRALIAMDAHRIEKALALRAPRVGFGMWFIPRLIRNVGDYRATYGTDRWTSIARDVLTAYAHFNEQQGHPTPLVRAGLAALPQTQGDAAGSEGGVLSLSATDVRRDACRDLRAFFGSRHSIRQFGDSAVPRDAIKEAVSMAIYSPSVCNRQSWRVHVYAEPDAKASLLKLQNGNRGFGDQAAHVLVVTADLESFTSVGERNQCWIDGGMFSMSLVYALHSLGMGTCCLNWSVEKERDVELRRAAGIPESQAVIMMIAVGALPDTLTVARSPRKRLEDVVIFHQHAGDPPASLGTR